MTTYSLICSDNVDRIGETFPTETKARAAWKRHVCYLDHRVVAVSDPRAAFRRRPSIFSKLSGTSDSTVNSTEHRPEAPPVSDIGVGSGGRTLPRLLAESRGPDAGVDPIPPTPRFIPASVFEVADPAGRDAAMERAGL